MIIHRHGATVSEPGGGREPKPAIVVVYTRNDAVMRWYIARWRHSSAINCEQVLS